MRQGWMALVAVAAVGSVGVAACSSGGGTAAPTAADAGRDGGAAPRPEAGVRDAGPQPGSSCALPIEAELGASLDGAIDADGKSVYYSVPVKAGDFLVLDATTAATAESGEEIVDTAITVFNADGSQMLANLDDAFPRYTTDAELFHRVKADGTLCVRVTDFATWSGEASLVAVDPNYTFSVGKISPAADVVTFDAEPNDTDAAPQAGKIKAYSQGNGGSTFLVGVLASATDVDTFKFTLPTGAAAISVEVPPIGAPLAAASSSYGSTMERFTVTVKKTDGTVVAELAPPAGNIAKVGDSLSAPLSPGEYLLTVSRPAGLAAGANDFYATTVNFSTTNTAETETLGANTNDTLATAQNLALTAAAADPKRKSGYLLGFLPAGDAADSFQFAVGANDQVGLSCGAARNGSGLEGFKAELFVAGTSKQVETESVLADLSWSGGRGASKAPVTATAAGTAVLQLSATGRSARNTGSFYLCGVHVVSP